MDILSQDTLTLLQNSEVRKAVEDALNDADHKPGTVTVQRESHDRSHARQEPTQLEVTVRRIA